MPCFKLEWVAISFFRGSSQPRDQTWVSCIAGKFFTPWAIGASPTAQNWASIHMGLALPLPLPSQWWVLTLSLGYEISSDFAYLGPSTFFLCRVVLYPPVAESMGRRVREAQILVFALCSWMEWLQAELFLGVWVAHLPNGDNNKTYLRESESWYEDEMRNSI